MNYRRYAKVDKKSMKRSKRSQRCRSKRSQRCRSKRSQRCRSKRIRIWRIGSWEATTQVTSSTNTSPCDPLCATRSHMMHSQEPVSRTISSILRYLDIEVKIFELLILVVLYPPTYTTVRSQILPSLYKNFRNWPSVSQVAALLICSRKSSTLCHSVGHHTPRRVRLMKDADVWTWQNSPRRFMRWFQLLFNRNACSNSSS